MGNFTSLIFYVVSFFISFWLYFLYNKHNKKTMLVFAFLIPLFIGGLRYNVGTDYMTYVNIYNKHKYIDVGFSFVSSIAKYFNGVYSLFFIYNFLTLLFIFLGLKNYDKKIRPLIYFCFMFLFYTTSFNIIRQFLAISIVFYAYKYLVNKKLIRWTLWVAIACCFHSTAIICFPLYFIANNNSKILKFALLVVITYFSLNYINIIDKLNEFSMFSHYTIYQDDYVGNFNNMMFFFDLATWLYIFLHLKSMNLKDENNKKYFLLFTIGLILSLTGFFNPYIKRIANYLLILKVGLLPELVECSPYKKKLFNFMLVIIYCLILFVTSIYILKQSNIIPYNTYL